MYDVKNVSHSVLQQMLNMAQKSQTQSEEKEMNEERKAATNYIR